MSIKLITFSRVFFPFIWGYKATTMIVIYLVFNGETFLKRGFAELAGYTFSGVAHAEIDALTAGLSWITKNVPDFEKESLEVIFCGASRAKLLKGALSGESFSDYDPGVLETIRKFKGVRYSSQNKIVSDDPVFNLYGFSNEVFELFYSRDNGYLHKVHDEIDEKKRVHLVGEPEIRWKNGMPTTEWT